MASENEVRVWYKAMADFSDLSKKAKEAKKDIGDAKKAESEANKQSLKEAKSQQDSHKNTAKAVKEETVAVDLNTGEILENTKAVTTNTKVKTAFVKIQKEATKEVKGSVKVTDAATESVSDMGDAWKKAGEEAKQAIAKSNSEKIAKQAKDAAAEIENLTTAEKRLNTEVRKAWLEAKRRGEAVEDLTTLQRRARAEHRWQVASLAAQSEQTKRLAEREEKRASAWNGIAEKYRAMAKARKEADDLAARAAEEAMEASQRAAAAARSEAAENDLLSQSNKRVAEAYRAAKRAREESSGGTSTRTDTFNQIISSRTTRFSDFGNVLGHGDETARHRPAGGGEDYPTYFNRSLRAAERFHSGLRRIGNWRPRLTPPFIALIPIIGGLLGLVNPLVAGLGAVGAAVAGIATSLGSLVGGGLIAAPLLGGIVASFAGAAIGTNGVGTAIKERAAAKSPTPEDAQGNPIQALTPSADLFVENVSDMVFAWKGLQSTVQESLFSQFAADVPKLEAAIGPLERILSAVNRANGGTIRDLINLVSGEAWTTDMDAFAVGIEPVIANFGRAGIMVLDIFRNVSMAAMPLLTRFSEALSGGAENLAATVETARGDGSLEQWLSDLGDRTRVWWDIVKDLAATVANFSGAMQPFNDWLVGGLAETIAGWRAASEEALEPGSGFQTWLENIKPILSELNGLVGDFFGWFGGEASDTDNIDQIVDILDVIRTDIGPALAGIFDTLSDTGIGVAFVEALGSVLDLVNTFLDAGGADAFKSFLDTVNDLFDALETLADSEGGRWLISVLAPVLGTLAALSFVGKFSGLTSLLGILIRAAASPGMAALFRGLGSLGGIGGLLGGAGKGGGLLGGLLGKGGGLLRLLGPIGAILGGVQLVSSTISPSDPAETDAGSFWGNVGSSALSGGAIGAMFGPIGAALGALVGGTVGGFNSLGGFGIYQSLFTQDEEGVNDVAGAIARVAGGSVAEIIRPFMPDQAATIDETLARGGLTDEQRKPFEPILSRAETQDDGTLYGVTDSPLSGGSGLDWLRELLGMSTIAEQLNPRSGNPDRAAGGRSNGIEARGTTGADLGTMRSVAWGPKIGRSDGERDGAAYSEGFIRSTGNLNAKVGESAARTPGTWRTNGEQAGRSLSEGFKSGLGDPYSSMPGPEVKIAQDQIKIATGAPTLRDALVAGVGDPWLTIKGPEGWLAQNNLKVATDAAGLAGRVAAAAGDVFRLIPKSFTADFEIKRRITGPTPQSYFTGVQDIYRRLVGDIQTVYRGTQYIDKVPGANKVGGYSGGRVPDTQYFSDGGQVWDIRKKMFRPQGRDTVPAMLEPDEFVVKREVAKDNFETLNAINDGRISLSDITSGAGNATLPRYSGPMGLGNNDYGSQLQNSGTTIGTNIENLVVHNPIREETTESLARTVRKVAYT